MPILIIFEGRMIRDIRVKYSLLVVWLFIFIILFGFALGADLETILKAEAIFSVPAFIITLMGILFMPNTIKRKQQQLSEKLSKTITNRERIFIILPAIFILSLTAYFVRICASTYFKEVLYWVGVLYWIFITLRLYKKTKELQTRRYILSLDRRYNFILIISVVVAIAISLWLFLLLF